MAFKPGNGLPVEMNRAMRRDQPHDRLAGGRTAHAVTPKQAHDLAAAHIEIHPLQDMTLAVVSVQIFDFQHISVHH